MLSTEEAARRLGVKPSTLYAYVSRGLIASHRSADGRSSLFAAPDVEQLAVRSRGGRRVEHRMATVTTGVTQLHQDSGPHYRGRPATDLVPSFSFEQVAELLWQAPSVEHWEAPALGVCPFTDPLDRLKWAAVATGAADPLRSDLRPEAVVRAARLVIAGFVDVLGPSPTGESSSSTLATRLAGRIDPGASERWSDVVDAALILMADHELATSTMAVRLAASVRADLYDALLAGLAILAGPLHGGASRRAHELLVAAEAVGVRRAVNDELRDGGLLPGFGHMVYTDGDPRFPPLLALADEVLPPGRRVIVSELLRLVEDRGMPRPNCDLALAAISWGGDLTADVGRTLFAIARVAGWTAHYLEELGERPLRYRARAIYATESSGIS
jgi:citrate synthase